MHIVIFLVLSWLLKPGKAQSQQGTRERQQAMDGATYPHVTPG
ncbi:hypothetical protein B224_0672 [Aeromonas media WS]|nr:hypothetical protein B224_0672 [Aeromonas media WS]